MASLLIDVKSLCGLLDEENAMLASNSLAAHQEFTSRKLRLLRSLLGQPRAGSGGDDLKRALLQLKDALAANERLLSFHLRAMRSVTSAIVDGIRAEESDYTYQRAGPQRPRPSC